MSRNRVTLNDLSRELSLSTCTVSKILNRSFRGYSPETIRRVEACAARLGYAANAQARSLRLKKSMMVGFLLPSAEVSTFGALTDQLELALREHGYQLLSSHSHNDPKEERRLMTALLARGVDALLWIPARDQVDPKAAGLKSSFPAVILDRPLCSAALPFVATNNREAARELGRRVAALGHRQVGVLNAPEGDASMAERCEGLRDHFGEGLQVLDLPNRAEEARKGVARFFTGRDLQRPTALIALSEPLAIGAIAGLRDCDLQIGRDLSFASFDDFPLASHWTPRITAVRQNLGELARRGVELLLARMANPKQRFASIRVDAEIQWRESVV